MQHPKIIMTLLVRDEADILADTLRFHHAQGVDAFIVMDNLSQDETPDILDRLSREMPITRLLQKADTYAQSEWVTEMARMAAADGADWVINGDADEFWLPANGTLKELLAAVPDDVAMLDVARHNAVLLSARGKDYATSHPRDTLLFESESLNTIGKPLPMKCLHRASAQASVRQGNHGVSGVEGRREAAGAALKILHFPYRSLGHYRRKVTLGGAAYERNTDPNMPKMAGATWRQHYREIDTGAVEAFWKGMSLTPQEAQIHLMQGKLFRTQSLQQHLKGDVARKAQLAAAQAKLVQATSEGLRRFSSQMVEPLLKHPPAHWPDFPFFHNLQFCSRGGEAQQRLIEALPLGRSPEEMARAFGHLRDIYSLFPRNEAVRDFITEVLSLSHSEDVARLQQECDGKIVILHTSCRPRVDQAGASCRSFAALPEYHHITLVGEVAAAPEDELRLGLRYHDGLLEVPAPDSYEGLHRKLFYAFTLLHLLTKPRLVVKIDDNLHLKDAEVFSDLLEDLLARDVAYAGWSVGKVEHSQHWHGWHIHKCHDPLIEQRGYQYPLPPAYAAGGYGYVLAPKTLAACAHMYLGMKEFFAMRAIGLEDAFVGHAAQAEKIELVNLFAPKHRLAMRGLQNLDALR